MVPPIILLMVKGSNLIVLHSSPSRAIRTGDGGGYVLSKSGEKTSYAVSRIGGAAAELHPATTLDPDDPIEIIWKSQSEQELSSENNILYSPGNTLAD